MTILSKKKIKKRLVISFIGRTDLNYIEPQGENISPILRLLAHLSCLEPKLSLHQTCLLLFDDDLDGKTDRYEFYQKLQQVLPQVGLDGLEVERRKIVLPEGPTDLNALYEIVWREIPTSGTQRNNEVIFHLSSGTPAMKFTLLLAANCLPLENVRMFETAIQNDVLEVYPPYVLAARGIHERARTKSLSKLSDRARRQLIPDTVFDDPHVKASFAAIHRAATNRKMPQRLLIKGPSGSGKWRASEQFAKWHGGEMIKWTEWSKEPEIGSAQTGTLLIRHLDTWPEKALQKLTNLSEKYSKIAIAATFRTDHTPAATLNTLTHDGLRGAIHIELPSLGARSDVVALSEALLRQLGLMDGKLKERLQHDLQTDLYPRNLHDLKSLLATAAAQSSGAHIDRLAYERSRQIKNANEVLAHAWEILVGLEFGPGRPKLDDILDIIRSAIARRIQAEGRSQKEIGKLLGLSQQTVSDILKKESDQFSQEIWIKQNNEKV